MVINFIKSQWGSTDTLPGREISLKLCMLLARTTTRDSSLHHLDIRYIVNTGDSFTFYFHKLHKSWKKGKASPSVTTYMVIMHMKSCVLSKSLISTWKSQRGDGKGKYSFH